jgi:electron transfer flavoprotein-quinone oxidoreductase
MSSEEQLDVIVVGAGVGGLACAYEAARAGLQVAVLEIGDTAGAKSLTGGRLHLEPLRQLCGSLLHDAPFERPVVSESVVFAGGGSSATLRVDNSEDTGLPQSVTVLPGRLCPHLAQRATEKGALVLYQQWAERLVREDGQVVGVKVGPEHLRAQYVVAADGALSFLAEEAGLRPARPPDTYAVGIKEIIELDGSAIEERFNLQPGQGASRLFVGEMTRGLPGGGFIYTNAGSISLGMVVHLQALQGWESEQVLWELLESFKERTEVASLISGGRTVEYGAHLVPEGGFDHLPPSPGIPGLLLVGDAAGFVLNTGTTLRGLDLAIASGTLAARSIVEAKTSGLSATACLDHYKHALNQSFIMKQMKTHRKAPGVLALGRLYDRYPGRLAELAWELFHVDKSGESMSVRRVLTRLTRNVLGWSGCKDLWRMLRM